MNEKITALIVTLDDGKTEALRGTFDALPGFDVRVEGAKFNECVNRARQVAADVAIIFLEEQPGSGTVILEEMKKTRENVFAFAVSSERSAEVIVKAIRAGADELISDVPTSEELLKALVKIAERRKTTGAADAGGKVITIHGPRGGVGSSTFAVNLAHHLKAMGEGEVALVDLDLQAADVSVYMNFKPTYSIVDVVQNIDKLDNSFMQSSMYEHDDGIHILSAPLNLEDSEAVTSAELEKILAMLRTMYPFVVVDTAAHLNEVSLVALEQADRTFLVTDNMVGSVRGVQRLLDTLDRLGIDTVDYEIVMSQPVAKSDISDADIKEALNREVKFSLPADAATAVVAANQGEPLVKVNPRSELSSAIKAIASTEFDDETGGKASKGLFGRFMK